MISVAFRIVTKKFERGGAHNKFADGALAGFGYRRQMNEEYDAGS